jgi:hypothetical protein
VDLFLAYCHWDEAYASDLVDILNGGGLTVADPLPLWPGQRLLPRIDRRLIDARFALVIISEGFLDLSFPRKELDRLAIRRRVLPILADVTEQEVSQYSPRLAVAALPWTEKLVHLMRTDR